MTRQIPSEEATPRTERVNGYARDRHGGLAVPEVNHIKQSAVSVDTALFVMWRRTDEGVE